MIEKRLPVTILTGFLGAGKSTLLNRILAHPDSGPIAVIVNEFGEVGIDNDLIESSSEEVVLLSSGCICCSVRGDLAQTVARLMTQRARGHLKFQRIVIETTGLADPGPIQQTVLSDNLLSRALYLDGTVTLVDCANGPGTLDAQFEAVSQVAMADLLVLTKSDLVTPDRVSALRTRLRGLNSTAKIRPVQDAIADPGRLWGLTGARRDLSPTEAVTWMTPAQGPEPATDPLANLSGLAKATAKPEMSVHDSRISSESIVLTEPLTEMVFDIWLDTLLKLRGPQLLRVKGIVFLQGIDYPYVFHGVQNTFDEPVPLRDWPEGDTTTRIVVIARDMSSPELQRSLDMLRAKPAEPGPPVLT